MQNYRAGPVGPVGARGVPRGAGGNNPGGCEEEEEEEDEEGGRDKRARQHLNPPQLRA